MIACVKVSFKEETELSFFNYKCFLYTNVERYLIAYGELVVHNAPFNLFDLFLIPFTPLSETMIKASNYLSLLNFLFENIVFLMIFIVFEISLWPFV